MLQGLAFGTAALVVLHTAESIALVLPSLVLPALVLPSEVDTEARVRTTLAGTVAVKPGTVAVKPGTAVLEVTLSTMWPACTGLAEQQLSLEMTVVEVKLSTAWLERIGQGQLQMAAAAA